MRELLDAAVNNEVWARKLVTELQMSKPDQDMIVAIFDQILFSHTELISQYLQKFSPLPKEEFDANSQRPDQVAPRIL